METCAWNLIKCEVCGVPWAEHDPACANERHRISRMEAFAKLEDARVMCVIRANRVNLAAAGTPEPPRAPRPTRSTRTPIRAQIGRLFARCFR